MTINHCQRCGQEFTGTRQLHKYCSETCSALSRIDYMKSRYIDDAMNVNSVCPDCGCKVVAKINNSGKKLCKNCKVNHRKANSANFIERRSNLTKSNGGRHKEVKRDASVRPVKCKTCGRKLIECKCIDRMDGVARLIAWGKLQDDHFIVS